MAELLSIDNFKGMIADAPDGKQPEGTCKEISNLVYDRETGSLVTRFTYEASLARPTGVATLNNWLSYPVTYPSAQDIHLWFTEDGIFQRPHWHNSATVVDDWAKVTDSATVTFTSAPTVAGTATNTITAVVGDTYTALGLSGTTDYYRNWIFVFGASKWLIKSYTISANRPIWTLDQVIDVDTGVTVTDASLLATPSTMYRYFHKDVTFSPAFTTPYGYSTETGVRWSGGAGSTVGYKNIKSAYINKNFFAASTGAYTITGTYIDQAECFAPASTILSTNTFTNADANANTIAAAQNYDFSNGTTTDWSSSGNTTKDVSYSADSPGGSMSRGLAIYTNGGDGDVTTNYASLSTTYTNNVTNNVEYTVKIKGIGFQQYELQPASIGVRVIVNGVNYDSPTLYFVKSNGVQTYLSDTLEFTFTPNSTNKPEIRIYLPNVSKGHTNLIKIRAISITATSSAALELEPNKTYKLWASYVYDKTQESELTYLASKYLTGKFSKLSYELNQYLGALNKFVTAVRLYMSQEEGDRTATTTTTVAPRYLMATIPVDNDATATWVQDTANGKFEYASSFNGADWTNKGVTWEQKTKRTSSSSTTCSYSIARQASGRIFLADEYDYADARAYTNRVRFTGFNSDGAPTPDIFPNLQDTFITSITAGNSQQIKNIAEYEGDIIVLKKSSILRLDTSNPNPLTWELLLVKNGIGTQSKNTAIKFDRGLFFTDLYSAYLYDGYQVRDVLKGIWRNLYQSLCINATYASNQVAWYNPVNDTIAVTTGNSGANSTVFYEFNTNSWLPRKMDNTSTYAFRAANVVTTSDGIVHFAPASVGATAFKYSLSAGSVLVDISVTTGYYGLPHGKVGVPRWVYAFAESAIGGSDIAVKLYVDGTLIKTGTFTPTATTQKLYKYPIATDTQGKLFQLIITQTGVVAPSTKEFKLHRIWIEGDLQDEVPEITEAVVIA